MKAATGSPVPHAEPLRWDPFDVEIDSDPYDVWRRLRDEQPAYYNDEFDFWALSRYHDVEAASRDHGAFCSSRGTVLELMSDRAYDTAMIIFVDPPAHTRLRGLVSRAFTPRRVAALEARIRQLCATLLDPWIGSASFDYVEDFAVHLPAMVIASLLGVPEKDQDQVRQMIDTMFYIEPGVGMVNETALAARIKLWEYLTAALTERAEHPCGDMLSDLMTVEMTDDDGTVRRLSLREAADFADLLISAGTETVARLLGWSVVLLDEHPDQRAALAAEPTLIPNAIEEILRFEAPSPVQGRWLSCDVELHGHQIERGSKVLLLTGSAGRDERVYPDADRFDVRRSFDHHVSFGHGVHFCIGAALARMEGRISLEETLARFPTWSVDHDRAKRLHTSTVRGWASVPIVVPGSAS